jgi:hypothetical protein
MSFLVWFPGGEPAADQIRRVSRPNRLDIGDRPAVFNG